MHPVRTVPSGPLAPSELILNADGSVYHLGLKPGEVAQTVVIVGDPDRVDTVAQRFDSERVRTSNREFAAVTGTLGGKELTVVSTGIGVDNIDIVLNELDAVVNIDFDTRMLRSDPVQLDLIRLGTSGTFGPEIPLGTIVASAYAVGMEGLAWHYDLEETHDAAALSRAFASHTQWNPKLAQPYAVASDPDLLARFGEGALPVITLTANGFYGPQLRQVRLPVTDLDLLERLQTFSHGGVPMGNFEMECAGIYALGSALGHRVLTLCVLLAQRAQGHFVENPPAHVDRLLDHFFDRFTRPQC